MIASGYEVLHGVIAEGRIPVGRDDKYGYLDLTGSVAIPLRFEDGGTFSEGLAAVKKGSRWGYIDETGAVVIPFKFDSAGEFGSGLAPVTLRTGSGFIDHSGAFAFHVAFEFVEGFYRLEGSSDASRFWTKNHDFGYVNTSGKVIWGPTAESPDHAPLFGWSEEEKLKSCSTVPESVRHTVLIFPPDEDE